MKKWIWVSSLVIVIITCCLWGCTHNVNKTKEQVRLCEATHSIFYAPQYVAINKGFFYDQGLDIELTNGGGSDKVMSAILSGNIDIGLAGPETNIYVYDEGESDYPQIFAQLTKRDGSFLIARDQLNNFKWSDLKEKRIISGRKGGVPYMTLKYILNKNGLDSVKDVILDDGVQFDLIASAFSNGTADFMTAFEPTASQIVQEGKGHIVASLGSAGGEMLYTGYTARRSYIEKNEKTIQGFTSAVSKGQKWVSDHSAQEIAEIIRDQFPDTDIDNLSKAIQNYKSIDAWKTNPVMFKEDFIKLQEVMINAGELKENVPFENLVNNYFAELTSDPMLGLSVGAVGLDIGF